MVSYHDADARHTPPFCMVVCCAYSNNCTDWLLQRLNVRSSHPYGDMTTYNTINTKCRVGWNSLFRGGNETGLVCCRGRTGVWSCELIIVCLSTARRGWRHSNDDGRLVVFLARRAPRARPICLRRVTGLLRCNCRRFVGFGEGFVVVRTKCAKETSGWWFDFFLFNRRIDIDNCWSGGCGWIRLRTDFASESGRTGLDRKTSGGRGRGFAFW